MRLNQLAEATQHAIALSRGSFEDTSISVELALELHQYGSKLITTVSHLVYFFCFSEADLRTDSQETLQNVAAVDENIWINNMKIDL